MASSIKLAFLVFSTSSLNELTLTSKLFLYVWNHLECEFCLDKFCLP
jgi:hypothetical protein